MFISISIPPGLAYGADEAVPDMPAAGMSVEDALYHTVHGFPGGVAALAARMGVSANTLTHKVNPNNDTHHAKPRELVAVQYLSGNFAVAHAMCAELGLSVYPALPAEHGGSPAQAMVPLQLAMAQFVAAAMEAPQEGGATGNQLRKLSAMAADLHACIDQVVAAHRGVARPAPKGGV